MKHGYDVKPKISFVFHPRRLAYAQTKYRRYGWNTSKFSLSWKDVKTYGPEDRLWQVSNNKLTRWDHIQMSALFNCVLNCDHRHYAGFFENFEKIYAMCYTQRRVPYQAKIGDDFWSQFQHNLFRREMRNDQANQVYIGLDERYITKKIGRKPTPFEMILQRIYRNIFINCAHDLKKNWVRVWISW